jgi:hypothetical protein
MFGLEFEQKFVLDLRRHEQIKAELAHRVWDGVSGKIVSIRQFYDEDGDRYRVSVHGNDAPSYIRETKRSVKIGAPYSISLEQEKYVSDEDFEKGWEKNKTRRLQKTRYTVPGHRQGHKVMVDFFFTKDINHNDDCYAIIAEAETVLKPDTQTLYLDFCLPIYLERFSLIIVNDSDPAMKVFKSANMVDTPEKIEQVRKAISKFYE